jgi:hypothetical protein
MRFELSIACKTKAFGLDDRARGVEIGNILIRAAADLIDGGARQGATLRLHDQYGNAVGEASLMDSRADRLPLSILK